jgi:hypothetical protein
MKAGRDRNLPEHRRRKGTQSTSDVILLRVIAMNIQSIHTIGYLKKREAL